MSGKEMKRYASTLEKAIPAVCPLISECQQYKVDLADYEVLRRKWSEYARSQDKEAAEVKGSQVFYLEYLENKRGKEERFQRMCPHFKRDVLGLDTSSPPYLDCLLFSKWYYQQERRQ